MSTMRTNILTHYRQAIRYWPWLLRLIVLVFLVWQIAPVTHRVLPQAPQTVITQRPHVCVHTNLIDEVDEWKIQRSLELVREMGAETIVEFFPWSYLQPGEQDYNWYQPDRIVHHAQQQGIQIIARLGLVPQWARPDDTTPGYLTDERFADFADFAAAFAARYAGHIDHYIIWNEPNLAFEWGFFQPQPERYVKLLRAVYAPIHRANPDAVILAGALAPTLEPEGSSTGMNDLRFLKGMYAAGAADYFDALAIHTYGFTTDAEDPPAAKALNFRRAELLRDIMEANDDAETPVYITESGWNDSPRWTLAVTPSQRVAQTLTALEHAENDWPWADQVCLWLLRYPRPQGSYRDHFTMITPEFQLKPIYHAVRAYARGEPQDATLWLPAPGTDE